MAQIEYIKDILRRPLLYGYAVRRYQINFIAVQDGVEGKNNNDYTAFRFVCNDFHVRDTSKKVRAIKDMQAKNDMNILSPQQYRYNKGTIQKKPYMDDKKFWYDNTINRILQSPVYIGCMVQGKTKTSLIQGFRLKKTNPDEWIVVPNTHKPIIDMETFDKVQKILDNTRKKYHEKTTKHINLEKNENIFKGLVRCGDCNTNMVRRKTVYKYEEDYIFSCRTYERSARRICNLKSIREKTLKEIVLGHIQNEIALYCDKEKLIKKLQNSSTAKEKAKAVKAQVTETKRKIDEKERRLTVLYDDYSDGVLNKDEYLFTKAKYSEERRLLQEQLDDIVSQSMKQNNAFASSNKWLSAVTKFNGQAELTREMLTEIVDKIEINNYNNVDVVFKYRNEYRELNNLIPESEAV